MSPDLQCSRSLVKFCCTHSSNCVDSLVKVWDMIKESPLQWYIHWERIIYTHWAMCWSIWWESRHHESHFCMACLFLITLQGIVMFRSGEAEGAGSVWCRQIALRLQSVSRGCGSVGILGRAEDSHWCWFAFEELGWLHLWQAHHHLLWQQTWVPSLPN